MEKVTWFPVIRKYQCHSFFRKTSIRWYDLCTNINAKPSNKEPSNKEPSSKEPPNEVSCTAYIWLNHFKEILSQFQAKETTQIPPHVIEAIKGRIIKERITDTTKLNYMKLLAEVFSHSKK